MLDHTATIKRLPEAGAAVDPIFAAMAEYKAAVKERLRRNAEAEELLAKAVEIHGEEPSARIEWRFKKALWGKYIDEARDEFLAQTGADPAEIERAYQRAKAREAAAIDAQRTWQIRTGVAARARQIDLAWRTQAKAAKKLGATTPTTVAGMAALIDYALREIKDDIGETGNWEFGAIRKCVVLLKEGSLK